MNAPPGFDPSGGAPQQTPFGPAVYVPLAWLGPGQLALVCADRCVKRLGEAVSAGHVMQEAVKLEGRCRFCLTTAKKALREHRTVTAK